MTKLEKYLTSTASDIIEAETTISRYFIVDCLKIRMSDHFSNQSDADLQVIVPYNGGTSYIVTIKDGSGKFLNWNAKQIIEFIPALRIIKDLKSSIRVNKPKKETPSQKIEKALTNSIQLGNNLIYNGPVIDSKLKIKNLNARQRDVFIKPKTPWNQDELNQLHLMLFNDIGNGSVNEDMRIFLTCTSINYKEILNIANILLKNNKIATIELLQEAYQLYEKL